MERMRFYLGVFVLTMSTLMLEVIQTRIMSVVAWYYLAFLIISIAMFGMTAGAVWVYLRGERFTKATLSHDLSWFTTAFAVTTVISLASQMTLVPVAVRSITGMVVWLQLVVFMAVPFFFSGVAVSLALTRSPYPIGKVYGVDLVGAAVGTLGVLLVLNQTDGPSAVLWVATLAAGASVLFQGSGIGGKPERNASFAFLLRRPVPVFAVLAVLALANNLSSNRLQPMAIKGQLVDASDPNMFEEWNTFSRVAVKDRPGTKPYLWGPSAKFRGGGFKVDQRALNIDGLAGTRMFRFDGRTEPVEFLKFDVTNLPYFLPDRERGAVIGVGGGRDLLSAWVFGLRDVTGVEINPIFIKLLTEEPGFHEYAGLSRLKGMRLFVDEARSWFARTDETFDIIQMSLIDTWAATGAGAFTLSENSLYTLEAWRIFLGRLRPGGVYSVSRWHAEQDLSETGRMISLAVAVLIDLGVEDPSRHVYVATSGKAATMLISPTPLQPPDLRALNRAVREYRYEILVAPGVEPPSEVLHKIIGAKDRAELDVYTASLELDLSPPTDNRPFFFNQLPFDKPLQLLKLALASDGTRTMKGGVVAGNLAATWTLLTLFLVSLLLVMATIVIPLRPAIKEVGGKLVKAGTAYFLLIGIGFMLVEIGMLQRMSVFLGHPVYSLSIVLFTVILSTGIGSFLSDRRPLDSRRKFTTWAMLTGGYFLTLPLWMPGLFLSFDGAGLITRAMLCVVVLAPAGMLMGFGFPTGMRLTSAVDERPTPWFWGINGAAGVLASILAVVISIAFGINVTVAAGALCYLALVPVAASLGFAGDQRASEPSGP